MGAIDEPISGSGGDVLIGLVSIGNVLKWKFFQSRVTKEYASSATGGYQDSIAGVQFGSGSVEFAFDNVLCGSAGIIENGVYVTLKLCVNETHYYTVPAVVKTLSLECDIDEGKYIGGTFDFKTRIGWTLPNLMA
jgi:hypothetical protein